MLRWLPLAFVACATPPTVIVEERNDPPPVASPVVATNVTPPSPRTGMTSGFISVVTGPEDASFVVTSDLGGGLRLWPTLDGTREPLVIPTLRRVGNVDAIHDGDGIAVAALDSLGELEILRITLDGQLLSDVDVALDRPVVTLGATGQGFIVMRDDQRIAAFDSHGVARGEVDPEPGVRVHNFVERSGHVLAIFEGTTTHRRGRMLELDERGLSWGARTATLAVAADQLALSPSGTRLVGVRDQLPVVVDLATGHKVAAPAIMPMSFEAGPNILAFVDERTVWFTKDGTSYEWPIAGDATLLEPAVTAGVHVTAHAVIARQNQALEIITRLEKRYAGYGPDEALLTVTSYRTRYLGYRTAAISDLVPAPDGWVATDGLRVVHYDPQFASVRAYSKPAKEENRQFALIDAEHVVTYGYSLPQELYTLGSKKPPTPLPTSQGNFSFERSTGLAMNDDGADLEFAQWDPARGTFGHSVAHWDHAKTGTAEVRLYDPAASGGVIAAATAMAADYQHVELTSFHRIEVTRPSPFRTTTRQLPRPVVSEELFQTALAGLVPPKPAYAASSDRTLIVELLDGRMTLRDRDGNERWTRTSRGAFGVVWTVDDELIAYGQGVAKVDLETGDFIDARCGWQFGLWKQPVEAFGNGQMCMEP
jgi:hypothetical protein